MSISLRAITLEDEPFLFAVYSSTRADELALVDWSAEQKDAFLRMQFVAQSRHYTENYPDAEFQVIELDGQRIGRLYTQRRENEIRIMDIALLPEVRGRGIGTGLLNEILDEARAGNLPVTIHVERMNPALHLYERLGFYFLEQRGIYFLMEWRAVIMEAEKHVG